jgi:hypothetical protein
MRTTKLGLLLALLLAAALLLSGCKSTLVVRNTAAEDVIAVFKDYAGTHGYQITYANDETGSYRLGLGNVYVPERSETTKSKFVVVQPPAESGSQPLTSYEDTTWRTVSTPGHYVEANAMVSIVDQGNDTVITVDTNNVGGASLDDLRNYLKEAGYVVENK